MTIRPRKIQPTVRLLHPLADACAALGVSRATAYREINAGNLAAVKIGSRTYITDDKLRRYLEALPTVGRPG